MKVMIETSSKANLSNYLTIASASSTYLNLSGSNANQNIDLGAFGLTAGNITDSGLTITRIPYASTAGLLINNAALTFSSTTGLTCALNAVFGDSTVASIVALQGATSTNRSIYFYTGTNLAANLRWGIRTNSTAESGSNAGSNFVLFSSDDTGATIASNLTITRSTGAWVLAFPVISDAAVASVSLTPRQNITATAGKNFLPFQITPNEVINATFTNSGTVAAVFVQHLRANVAGAGDGGTLTSQYGHNLNVGHTSNDKYVNPLTSTVAASGSVMNIVRGTISNSYTILGSANNTLATPSTWVANTVYAVTDRVKPTVANGYYYACSTAGTSDPTTEPVWPATSTAGGVPATIADGTAVWTEIIVPSITNERGIYITSTTTHNYFGGSLGIGSTTAGMAKLRLASNRSMAAWGVNGCDINVAASTCTDTSSSGTVASAAANAFNIPTFAASSVTTFTDAATLYIAGVPAVGTNVTITKAWSQWIDAGNVRWDGLMGVYNAITTVSNGIPSELATVDLTGQTAAIVATTIYAVPASGVGMYRVSWVATVTTAATTSCILGGANGFQLKYTDADTSVVKTSNPTTVTVSAVNATGTSISGSFVAYCKASTNLQYLFDYTSVGATPMAYNLHIKVEAL